MKALIVVVVTASILLLTGCNKNTGGAAYPAPPAGPSPSMSKAPAPAQAADFCSPAASDKAEEQGAQDFEPNPDAPGAMRSPEMRVNGKGHLPFYSAPNPSCRMDGLFIVPGDIVKGLTDYRGFTLVLYGQKDGNQVQGWVRSDRLTWLH